jgi:hypothetical protein
VNRPDVRHLITSKVQQKIGQNRHIQVVSKTYAPVSSVVLGMALGRDLEEVVHNSNKVAYASGYHKQMPDRMVHWLLFHTLQRVNKPLCTKPSQVSKPAAQSSKRTIQAHTVM